MDKMPHILVVLLVVLTTATTGAAAADEPAVLWQPAFTDKTATSIVLQWSIPAAAAAAADATSTPDKIEVQRMKRSINFNDPDLDADYVVAGITPGETSITIMSLQPATWYRFRLVRVAGLDPKVYPTGSKNIGPLSEFIKTAHAPGDVGETIDGEKCEKYCIYYWTEDPGQCKFNCELGEFDEDETCAPPRLLTTPESASAYTEQCNYGKSLGKYKRAPIAPAEDDVIAPTWMILLLCVMVFFTAVLCYCIITRQGCKPSDVRGRDRNLSQLANIAVYTPPVANTTPLAAVSK
jgi:hypothetical protein